MHVITILGEQPIPSLMVLRHLNPSSFTIVATKFTFLRAERVKALLAGASGEILNVLPYQFKQTAETIRQHAKELLQNAKEIAFDLTGGTKIMALAAYDAARVLKIPIYYLQTQRGTVLFRYSFTRTGDLEAEVATPLDSEAKQLISLEDYLNAYLGEFQITGPCRTEPGRSFEIAVKDVLSSAFDEVMLGIKFGGALDIDLAVRLGSRVGVAELKTGKKAENKRPLEQVNAACGRAFLGIYTKKFLISDRVWGGKHPNLTALAEAWGVKVIELPTFGKGKRLSDQDQEKLIREVKASLEG